MSGEPGIPRLGPLVADRTGAHLENADGHGCRFHPGGVELTSPSGDLVLLPWSEVHSVTVACPVRHRWLRAAPDLVLSALSSSAGDVRSRSLIVQIGDRWGNGPGVDLGRVGPYPWRAAVAVEALFRALSDRGRRLSALGDPALAAAMLSVAATTRPRRLPHALDTVLPAPRR